MAAHGGICAYTFRRDGSVEVEPLEMDPETLRQMRDQLLLFYTGHVRSASRLLSDQDTRSREGDPTMIENLQRTKVLGYESRELLLKGDLAGYASLMHEHWTHKRERSEGMASERIDRLYEVARGSGAVGGKLVGAGGGGFLLVFTDRPEDTRRAMAEERAPELAFKFEFGGAVANEFT